MPENLNPIEMALVAELDVEIARGYDEVAEDESQGIETRRNARAMAARWRARARLWHLEARRSSDRSILPESAAYDGPERRKRERRRGERRAREPVASGRTSRICSGPDRRVNPDRRQGDRRGEDRR